MAPTSQLEQCKETILKSNNKHKSYYDKNLSIIRKLEFGDVVVTRKVIAKSKIDDRWNGEPYEVVQIPDSDIPVCQVQHIETGRITSKHRNGQLPIFGHIIKGSTSTKIDKPKPVMSQPTPEDNDYEENQEDSIINIPVVYTEPVDDTNNHDHIDSDETTKIELDNETDELSTNEGSTDEDEMTPLRPGTRIRHPPDRFSPSTYTAIVYSTRL